MSGMSSFEVVGAAVPRVDAFAKVSGAALYSADVKLDGTLWGKVLRSSLPHARIVSVDATAARRLPGVRAVITAADLPDPGRLIGRRLRDVPILAWQRVRFIGGRDGQFLFRGWDHIG